jgi:hypothetical protein
MVMGEFRKALDAGIAASLKRVDCTIQALRAASLEWTDERVRGGRDGKIRAKAGAVTGSVESPHRGLHSVFAAAGVWGRDCAGEAKAVAGLELLG